MKAINIKLALILILGMEMGCSKFLDEKPNKKLVVPTTSTDLQAIMDDAGAFNQSDPNAMFMAGEEFYMETTRWQSSSETIRNQYLWAAARQFPSTGSDEWTTAYLSLHRCNVVFDNLDLMSDFGSAVWRDVKGQAHFHRGKIFFNNLMAWTVGYQAANAANQLGIPIRLDANFNVPSVRASQKESFDQAILDLRIAITYLPQNVKTPARPSKAAAMGLLARIFLATGEIDSCYKYTRMALDIRNNLMDYNGGPGITPTAEYPFAQFNPEVIFDSSAQHPTAMANGFVESELLNSYQTNDLRRTLFFRNQATMGYFKGSYANTFNFFSGIATDELYLMDAECLVRKNQWVLGIEALNKLLVKRYRTGTFVPLTAIDQNDALSKVLMERRKQLVMRGLRWMDVKRLNAMGAEITLSRTIANVIYKLLPNDKGFAMPIPERTIELTGMPQNPR